MRDFANAFKTMFFGGNQEGNSCNWGKGNGEWKKNRALIVKVPSETFYGNPGETIMVEIIMKNNSHWPWKNGFTLQSLPFEQNDDIEKLVLPIDFFVDKNSTFNMLVPVKIKKESAPGQAEKVAKFTFMNCKGTPFGEVIEIKYKIVEPMNEVQFYQTAMNMFEN